MLLAALVVACDGGEEAPAASTRLSAELPGGATVSLDPAEAASSRPAEGPTEGPARFAWELDDGTRITLQTIPAESDALAPGESRTAASIAIALTARFELGEADGELSHVPCTVAPGITGECVLGRHTTEGGTTWLRRGAVFAAGSDFVWLDVAAPNEEAARAHAERVRESVVVTP